MSDELRRQSQREAPADLKLAVRAEIEARREVALSKTAPWDTTLLNGNVLATDGKKMSKSLGNIISPAELQRDYPVDAIRQWAAMSGAMAKDRATTATVIL